MSGSPRKHSIDRNFVIVYVEVAKLLGDYNCAAVWQRIVWKCEDRVEWAVTQQEMAEKLGLTRNQVRRAIATLLEKGWIAVRQEPGSYDHTRIYSVIWDDEPEHTFAPGDIPNGAGAPIVGSPSTNLPIEETKEETNYIRRFAESTDDEWDDGRSIPDRAHYSFAAKNGINEQDVRILANQFTADYPNRTNPRPAFTRYIGCAVRVMGTDDYDTVLEALDAITDAYRDDPHEAYDDGHNLNPGAA